MLCSTRKFYVDHRALVTENCGDIVQPLEAGVIKRRTSAETCLISAHIPLKGVEAKMK